MLPAVHCGHEQPLALGVNKATIACPEVVGTHDIGVVTALQVASPLSGCGDDPDGT
jgi:hypothetical protein